MHCMEHGFAAVSAAAAVTQLLLTQLLQVHAPSPSLCNDAVSC